MLHGDGRVGVTAAVVRDGVMGDWWGYQGGTPGWRGEVGVGGRCDSGADWGGCIYTGIVDTSFNARICFYFK